jgi:hypothetical protein
LSRFLTKTENDETIEEIESMKKCKWLINEVCCNDKSDCLGDFPYPSSICEIEEDGKNYMCGCFEKENGIIE